MSKGTINPNINDTVKASTQEDPTFRYKAGVFLASVAGMSALFGFGATIASVKKSDPKYFNKGLEASLKVPESGASLALRALGWGTVYAFSGCGVLFYAIWKLSGAEDLKDFRHKVGSVLPRIPKNNPPQGRTEFTGMNDLLEYLQTAKSKNDK